MPLTDTHMIINPLNNDLKFGKGKIENIFENLIIAGTMTCSPYILNHLSYEMNLCDNIQLQNDILNSIQIYFKQYLKDRINVFRRNSKRNTFNISSLTDFINIFHKLLIKVNNLLIHFSQNHNVLPCSENILGSSVIITEVIDSFEKIILNDVIISHALCKNINDHNNIYRNTILYKFISCIKDIYPSCIIDYKNAVETALLEIYDEQYIKNNSDITNNMLEVYRFKELYKFYETNIKKYYYLKNHNYALTFYNILKLINISINNIIKINDFTFVENFIKVYKVELANLYNYTDLTEIFLGKQIHSFDQIVNYYEPLFEILKMVELKKTYHNIPKYINMIVICTKINPSLYENQLTTLTNIINTNIIKNNMVENLYCNEFLYLIASSMFPNIDEVLKNLSQLLIKRIVYNVSNLQFELKQFEFIQKYFITKHLHQYNKIISDLILSKEFTSNKNTFIDYKCFHEGRVYITSLDTWGINYEVGNVKEIQQINNIFTSYLDQTLQYFKKFNPKKYMILYPHLGTVDITINNDIPTNIILSPAMMMCLELFLNNESYCYDTMLKNMKDILSQYNDEYIKNIIYTFVIGQVLTSNHNIYFLNCNMNQYINLIEIFNNHNDSINLVKSIPDELAHERNDIIMSNINSILKKTNNIDRDVLFTKCHANIIIFDLTTELFDIAITSLMNKDIISIEDNMNKIMWT